MHPDAEYILREDGVWVARERDPEATAVKSARGSELVGLEYEGPFDHLPAQEGVVHRVIPWDDVSLAEGTGIVHIAPGAGSEDFELGRIHGLPVLAPLDEAGRMLPGFGFDGLSTDDVAEPVIADLEQRGLVLESGRIVHRYPTCCRPPTPLVFRVVDDWFISAEEIRQPMLDANAKVEWTPSFYSKRMDDWLRTWATGTSRASATSGCRCRSPLRGVRDADRGGLTARARGAGALRPRPAEGATPPLDRPGPDRVCGLRRGSSPRAGGGRRLARRGHRPAVDARLAEPRVRARGLRDRGRPGPDEGGSPGSRPLGQWFPADWISEMREQIRLWFYSISFMSLTLVGRSPYERVLTYEKLLDETGREMHRSWGNSIDVDDAFARMGADVMRLQFTSQPPSQNLLFGFGPAREISRRLLTFWNSARFLADYANIEGWRPTFGDLEGGPEGELQPLDRWLVARTNELVRETTEAYESYLSVNVVRAFDDFVEDLSNWYIRRSRRRFWDGDEVAFRTLWYALVQSLRVVAPIAPFLSDRLWRTLATPAEGAPPSVHLAGWPDTGAADTALLAEIAELRRVVDLGRQARSSVGVAFRQPLRTLVVEGAPLAQSHADEIAEELRVRDVEFGTVEASELDVRPNLPVLGPKLGKELAAVRSALQAGEYEELPGGGFRAAGHDLAADEVLVERRGREGWAVAASDGVTVALDTALDDELRQLGRVYDLIHHVNSKRKEAGLELTDRISLTLPEADADLLEHDDWIARETLATSVTADGSDITLAKA